MSSATQRDTQFFEVGGTLPKDAPCYVVRPADDQLFSAVRRRDFCYLLTSRQMGKSSLMIRTTNRLREVGIAVVILDLTRFGTHNITVEQWYAGMLAEVGRSLDIRKEVLHYWKTQAEFSPTQRFFGALRDVVLPRVPGPIVLFVDEVDTVRSLPFSADEFFAGIRECYNRRAEEADFKRLVFGLFGVASPSDLIQDTRVTPFNIGTRIELTDFFIQDADVLRHGLGPNGQPLLERIFYWTGGHPYLTLKLCRHLSEALEAKTPDAVDKLAEDLFFGHKARDTDDNLLFVRRWLLEGSADSAAVLDLYQKVRQRRPVPDDETNALTEILHLSGIVKAKNGLLVVRNRLYDKVFDQKWIIDRMPHAELRRQKDAYRRGAIRTGSIGAAVSLAMALLAIVAVSQTVEAQKQKQRADQAQVKVNNQKLALEGMAQDYQRIAVLANNLAKRTQKQAIRENPALAREFHRLDRLINPISLSSGTMEVNVTNRSRSVKQATPIASPITRPVRSIAQVMQPVRSQAVRMRANSAFRQAAQTGEAAVSPSASSAPPAQSEPAPTPTTLVAENTNTPAPPTSEPFAPTPEPSTAPVAATLPEPIEAPPSPLPAVLLAAQAVAKPDWNPPTGIRYSGRVEVRVQISESGNHTEEFVQKTGIAELDEYLMSYFSRWRWKPAKLDGTPVKSTKLIRFRVN